MASNQGPNLRRGPVLAVIVAALVGGVIGGLIVDALRSDGSSDAESPGACPATSVAERDLPSVVTIKVGGAAGQGTGSGTIIRPDGYVLTNNHVIATAASGGRVEVVFNDGDTAAATIKGRDPTTDLAVLKVPEADAPKTIALGESSEVRFGAPVIALGAPLGLSNTVTSGIVSSLDRTISVPDGPSRALLVDAIQTDASINPGNSGGALVDCDGKLVGVPTAGATVPNAAGEPSSGSVGIGFAIPIDLANLVAEEIIRTGEAHHAYLGLQATLVQSPDGTQRGLQVTAVDPTGPAAQAGLATGDLITTIDGDPATSSDQLLALTLKNRAGDTLELEVERNGAPQTVTLTLGTAP
jgi:putative serine protease PepD